VPPSSAGKSALGQETLTVVAQVEEPELLLGVLAALASMTPSTFADPRLGIHFARIVYVPAEPPLLPWLVLESNFDTHTPDPAAAEREHVRLLAEVVDGPLSEAFEACVGFPKGAGGRSVEGFLARSCVPATASYEGHADRDLARIALEAHLREVVLTFLERAPSAGPFELFTRVRKHLLASEDPRLAGLDLGGPAPALPDPRVRSQKLKDRLLPWIENAAPSLPIYPRIVSILDWQTKDDTYNQRAAQEAWTPRDKQRFRDIAGTEDWGGQNALTHVVPLRGGSGRLGVLKSAHAYIDRMAQKYFIDVGQLGGIPTIHFAKWLLIDGGARLLFLSNYDGSWESYLGDFVDNAALGLNLAWSCTNEYPKTKVLAFDGAEDEATFKAWGRAHQVPTQIFYSAYPHLSIAAINNNTLIRHRLHDPRDAGDLDEWLRRLT
jgi:hypothetical protein